MGTSLLLSRLFSFTSLGYAWIVARMLKYVLYGIHSFGLEWSSDPGVLERAKFVFGTMIGAEAFLFLIAAAIADAFVWPILFREAVNECLAIEE